MFRPIRPKRVTHEIVSQIQELVSLGAFPPGSKLPPEREMAQQLGVSRPTLREALGVLEHMGLVRSVQGDGTYVVNPAQKALLDPLQAIITGSQQRMAELAEFRTEIEAWAAGLAAKRAGEDDLSLLGEILQEMKNAVCQKSSFHELDAEFHLAVARAAHNAVYYHVANTIFYLLAEITRISHELIFRDHEEQWALFREHEAIHEAIQRRDENQARLLMKEHLLRTEQWFKMQLGGNP